MKPKAPWKLATVVATLTIVLLAAGAWSAPARACRPARPQPSFSMEVLVDGRPLSEYAHAGTTYIEALKGREYEVRLRNETGERVAVALAVDGLNVIDAKHTTAREARKWILDPWETITLSGWQTSSGTARRFVFTSEAASYGAWLGRKSDLGLISAALFRERRRPQPVPVTAIPLMPRSPLEERSARAPERSVADTLMKSEATARTADGPAATGIGREIEHRVTPVFFDEEAFPSAAIDLRYEYHDALVRLGVIPATDEATARRERAHGFDEDGFAPDPSRQKR